jgi:hypothetical protein
MWHFAGHLAGANIVAGCGQFGSGVFFFWWGMVPPGFFIWKKILSLILMQDGQRALRTEQTTGGGIEISQTRPGIRYKRMGYSLFTHCLLFTVYMLAYNWGLRCL